MGGTKDLTGIKFGRLTVIERHGSDKYGNSLWLCLCECGNETIVRGTSLRNGRTTSCGCYKKEKTKEQWKNKDFRQMQSDKMRETSKKLWENEEFRQMQIDKMKRLNEQQWCDKEYRQMKSNGMKEQWQDENMKWRMGYKGGISPISKHLRSLPIVKQWKKDTYSRENNRCQLTHKEVHGGNSDIHHLKAFSTIVIEAHELHDIEIKPKVKDYTQEELHKLEKYVESWHKNTLNAVLLCKEVHELFHILYKYGDNTPEQFEEFKERYLSGEFSEIIK